MRAYVIRSAHQAERSNDIQGYANGASWKPIANHRHVDTVTRVSRGYCVALPWKGKRK
jgi:hypothetical protein